MRWSNPGPRRFEVHTSNWTRPSAAHSSSSRTGSVFPYRTLRRPPAVPLDPFAARAWHRELEALRDAREHVRFAALDDPHYGVSVVRVATRAATRPDLAGLRTGEHDATAEPGSGMGVDIEAVIDKMSGSSRSGRPHAGDYPPGLKRIASGQPKTHAPSAAA